MIYYVSHKDVDKSIVLVPTFDALQFAIINTFTRTFRMDIANQQEHKNINTLILKNIPFLFIFIVVLIMVILSLLLLLLVGFGVLYARYGLRIF